MTKITSCPICSALHMVEGVEPLGSGSDFRGRCCGRAVTGRSGRMGSKHYMLADSWRGIFHSETAYCGFPLLRPDGNEWIPLPLDELIRMTRIDFDPWDLVRRVLELNGVQLTDFSIPLDRIFNQPDKSR